MNATYRKNLKAVLEASKTYCDESIDSLKWELGTYDLSVDTVNGTTMLLPTPTNTIQATVSQIDGVSVKYNQLVRNGNFESSSGWNGFLSTLSVENNKATITATSTENSVMLQKQSGINIISGHKYLVTYNFTPSRSGNTFVYYGVSSSYFATTANVVNNVRIIFTASTNGSLLYAYMNANGNQVGDTAIFENLMLFDLTLLFGSGNEPSDVATATTQLASIGIDINTYNEYSTGKINNLELSGLKVEGENLFELKNPDYTGSSAITGYGATSYTINGNNFTGVEYGGYAWDVSTIVGQTYTLKLHSNSSDFAIFITSTIIGNTATFTATQSTTKISIGYRAGNNSTIQISLVRDSTAPTDFIPYIAPTTKTIDLSSILYNGSPLFESNALCKVVKKDILKPYKATKNISRVLAKTLDWETDATNRFYAIVSGLISTLNTRDTNVLCAEYTTSTDGSDMTIFTYSQDTVGNINRVLVYDNRFNSVPADFKAHFGDNDYIYFEITPIEVDIDFSQLVNFEAHSNGSITLVNTNNQDTTSTFKYLKEVAK